MSESKRVTRPPLERSAPIRSWSTLFGPPRAGGGDDIARGVNLGYQVIDDYLRQGREFARSTGAPMESGGGFPYTDPIRTADRMFQYATDFFSAWAEFMQATMRGSAHTEPVVAPFDLGDAGRRPEPAVLQTAVERVAVEVSARKPVEVAVELKPGSARLGLTAHALRAADPSLPRIGSIVIGASTEGDRLVARVRVPDDQPPGTYAGLVVETASNLPRGTVTLTVRE